MQNRWTDCLIENIWGYTKMRERQEDICDGPLRSCVETNNCKCEFNAYFFYFILIQSE